MCLSYQRSVAAKGVDYTMYQVLQQAKTSFFSCPLLDDSMACGECAYYHESIPPLPVDFFHGVPCGDCVFMVIHPYHSSRERLHSQFSSLVI